MEYSATSPSENPFIALAKRYKDDPVLFAREALQIEPDDWQCEFLRHVADPTKRRISVRSGHGVGKSTAVAIIAVWHVLWRTPGKVVMTAPTSAQLFDALFAEVKSLIKRLKPPLNDLLDVKSDRVELRASPADTFISCRTSRSEQPEALAGVHGPHVLLLADEASGVPEAVFESAAGSMSGHSATTILTGNPTRNTGLFYDTHHRLREEWTVMHVSCIDSKRVSADFINEMKLRYSENSPAYHVRVLGNFPPTEDNTVISAELAEGAMAREIEVDDYAAAVWGLDVARHGNDSSVLVKRQGPKVTSVRRWRNLDLMQLSGAVVSEFEGLPPTSGVCVLINVSSSLLS